jgi:hypothetical protein
MTNEELEDLLELGPVRLRVNGELKQFTRDMGTADTCNCHKGEKSCGFISELEWRDALLTWDKDLFVGVWDIGEHKFRNIKADQIEKIIGHGQDELEEKSCCGKGE